MQIHRRYVNRSLERCIQNYYNIGHARSPRQASYPTNYALITGSFKGLTWYIR